MYKQIQIFEQSKMTLDEAIEETLESLREYGSRFPYWVAAFSGGKDSTATVSLIAWAIKNGLVPKPKQFKVMLADTRMELKPLIDGAMNLLSSLESDGFETQVIQPKLDDRVFVAILGRGLPPFNNQRRNCTRMLKTDPMKLATQNAQNIDETLFFTGVRLGESRSRDERISVSCSRESGECGQGWFQSNFNELGYASLAPIVHWRVCNVFDWLYFEQDKHGYPVDGVLDVYGEDDIRTGCVACFVVEEDKPLLKISNLPEWAHLKPLLELKQVYAWLERWDNRLRRPLQFTKAGTVHQASGKVGPLIMDARKRGLEMVMDIQHRSGVELVNDEELQRIYWHWENNTWPRGWTGREERASYIMPEIKIVKNKSTKEVIGYTMQKMIPKISE